MANKVLPRNKIDKKFTWNAESVFPSITAWEKEAAKVVEDISKVKQYQGRLSESSNILLEAIKVSEELIGRAYKLYMYARFSYEVETTNQQAGGLLGKAQGIYGQVA